jgi:phage terminase large subunit
MDNGRRRAAERFAQREQSKLMDTVRLRMGPKCAETLFAKNVRYKCLFGGRGAEKSWSTAGYLIMDACKSCKLIVCARQFQNSIRDSSKELLERRIAGLGLAEQFDIKDQEIEHRHTGSRIKFMGLERNPNSIRSFEGADVVWIEEAHIVSAKSLEILIPTVRKKGSELIFTWNPEQPSDPVDQYFRGPHPPNNAIVTRVDFRDNPFFETTDLPGEMEKLKRDNYQRYLHVYEGEYDVGYESKVFTRVTIGRPENLVNVPPMYGIDFGFSVDPTAIVKVYHLPLTGQLYVAAEAYGHRIPTDQLPNLLSSIVPRLLDNG